MLRNQLNHQKLFQLAEWLKKGQKEITEKELNAARLAPIAAKALGFALTERNIATTAKIAGVKLHREHRHGGQATFNQAFAERLSRQETAITALVEQVARLDAEFKRIDALLK